jgi:hypothetical protein
MARNRLIAPETAIFFTDGNKEKVERIRAENETTLNSKLLGRAIIFYAAKDSRTFQNKIILNDDNISPIRITVENIASYRIRTAMKPAGAPSPVLKLAGVNDSFTYLGGEFAVTFELIEKLSTDAIRVYDANNESSDITELFSYNSSAKTLTLLPANYAAFSALFNDGWIRLSIHIGEEYKIELVLALSSADIFTTVTGEDAAALKNASAILAGSRAVNGFEFRQESKLNNNKTAVFRQAPFGVYTLTVFDLETDTFGSTEVSVPPEKTDLYLEVEVTKITGG